MTTSKKGGVYERAIATSLSEWWTDGQRTDVFWRVPSSGARAKSRGRKGLTTFGQAGDIAAIDPIGAPFIAAFTLELKRGYTSKCSPLDSIDRPAKSKPSLFENWMAQAMESANQAKTPYWLIVFKRDRRESLVAYPKRLNMDMPTSGKFNDVDGVDISIKRGYERIRIVRLDDFLSHLTRRTVEILAKAKP